MNSLIGTKINQSQMFDEKGMRIAVTNILAGPCVVVSIKEEAKDGFNAVIVGFGQRRLITVKKPIQGILKKAGIIEKPPRFYKELRITSAKDEKDVIKLGQSISVGDVLKEGDIVQVTGTSKGAGFAGVVKRHHFKGGPRTHGQSDRERAPGSIGQTTTPGRVYKGKRMAGRMGHETATIRNLMVVDVSGDDVFIKGLVPGALNSLVVIRKTGESKKFIPLWKETAADAQSLPQAEAQESKEEKIEPVSLEEEEKSAAQAEVIPQTEPLTQAVDSAEEEQPPATHDETSDKPEETKKGENNAS